MTHTITIVGAGLAGYTLAREIRVFDPHAHITLITADKGQYYYKPHLSAGLAKFSHAPDLIMNSPEEMAQKLNLNLLTQTYVETIDTAQHELITSMGRIPYTKLALAVGATPTQANFGKKDSPHIHSVNHLDDYLAFREKLADTSSITIIGAGLVGCEFADDLANAGYHVNVVAPSRTPLEALLPPVIGEKLQHALSQKGVKWYLGQTIIDLTDTHQGCHLTLSDGTILHTDHVLTAIGIQPNIALAQKSGIHTHKGIVVDQYLRTNIENIFAVGDCAEVNGTLLPYIAPMQHCVKRLAKILFDDLLPVDYPPMPIIIKTPSLPIVALPPPLTLAQHEWEIEQDGEHMAALLYAHGELKGFVLTGNRIKERAAWLKHLTPT